MEWELFRGVPEEDVRRVLAGARRRSFKRNEVLFHEGDPADSLHLIAKGRVAVQVNTPMGEHTTIDVSSRGEVIGEMALLDDTPRMATVVALEPTETLAVHRSEFERVRAEFPSVQGVLTQILAARIRNLGAQLVEAVYSPVERRILRRLCHMADVYADGDGETAIPLTQEHLAGLAGTTRSTVNRVLRREEKDGLVTLRRGRIVVLDLDGLKRRAR